MTTFEHLVKTQTTKEGILCLTSL